MKRLSLIFLLAFIAIGLYAQGDHLRFMGIPLNGTISQFQDKLSGKGVALDRETNKLLPAGTRAFKGTFSGESANIFVYYDVKNKIVYRAKAVITCNGKTAAENKLYQFRDMLCAKYPDAETQSGMSGEYTSFTLKIPNVNNGGQLGYIELYLTDSNYSFIDDMALHIDYEDYTNTLKHTKQNLDDL